MGALHATTDGWVFEVGDNLKPLPGEFHFERVAGLPAVRYTSGHYAGVKILPPALRRDQVRAAFLCLGFVEDR